MTVNIITYHVSGYNRLYDRNVPVWLTPGQDASNVYRSRTSITYTNNSTNWRRLNSSSNRTASLCFPDDRLITGPSTMRVGLHDQPEHAHSGHHGYGRRH
ncbi:MAG: hypothetical protein OXF20_00010 [Gammaproteobacteria bacterium]|nr:hypothetical protein [Gammaproteobacteria bacterium]